MFGGKNRIGYTTYVNERVSGLVCTWAVLGLLDEYERYLSTTRDLSSLRLASKTRLFGVLGMVRTSLTKGIDISSSLADLHYWTDPERFWLGSKAETFTPCAPRADLNADVKLHEVLRQSIHSRTERIMRIEQMLRDLHLQYATILSVIENINLQRQMRAMTVVIIVLTMIAVLVPYSAAWLGVSK